MTGFIHPTVILEGEIKVHDSVRIGPYSVLQGKISIGDGTVIGPHVNICGNVSIGARNKIHFGASIGEPAQAWLNDMDFAQNSKVVIGDDNIIRENATVHGSARPQGVTSIGSSNRIYVGAHIAHDCLIANGVTMVNNVLMAGASQAHDKAYIAGAAMITTRTRIGRGAMVEAGALVTADVAPFFKYSPKGKAYRLCLDVLKKTCSDVEAHRYREIFQTLKQGTTWDALYAAIENDSLPLIAELHEFMRTSSEGMASVVKYRRAGALKFR